MRAKRGRWGAHWQFASLTHHGEGYQERGRQGEKQGHNTAVMQSKQKV